MLLRKRLTCWTEKCAIRAMTAQEKQAWAQNLRNLNGKVCAQKWPFTRLTEQCALARALHYFRHKIYTICTVIAQCVLQFTSITWVLPRMHVLDVINRHQYRILSNWSPSSSYPYLQLNVWPSAFCTVPWRRKGSFLAPLVYLSESTQLTRA